MLRFKNYVGFIESVVIVNSLMLVLTKNQKTRDKKRGNDEENKVTPKPLKWDRTKET